MWVFDICKWYQYDSNTHKVYLLIVINSNEECYFTYAIIFMIRLPNIIIVYIKEIHHIYKKSINGDISQ